MLHARYDGFKKPFHPNSFGIEIELEGVPIDRTLDSIGRFLVKEDGSLNGYHGREFVSHPETSKRLKQNIRSLYKQIGVCVARDNCGIHVHVSRSKMTMDKAVWLAVALRNLRTIDFWEIAGRERNRYCGGNIDSKYSPINVLHPNTFEFRVFASSAKSYWPCHCVDVAEALCAFDFGKDFNLSKFRSFFHKRYGRHLTDVRP